ncbi:uncharacterized protein ARMOST_22442 [Armillaria ostoyae]|uniref:Uncharacterized protein n=1 Tax=Armillaria ostoyae TaxID=47428 RepID=A0A284SCW5_ARMOS|nr:uncharacterized protein ARMOST_22442 [Armillaria ostoyae]
MEVSKLACDIQVDDIPPGVQRGLLQSKDVHWPVTHVDHALSQDVRLICPSRDNWLVKFGLPLIWERSSMLRVGEALTDTKQRTGRILVKR